MLLGKSQLIYLSKSLLCQDGEKGGNTSLISTYVLGLCQIAWESMPTNLKAAVGEHGC